MTGERFEIEIWDVVDLGVIPEILIAASESHGIPQKDPEWFLWKFRDSPWGPAVLAYARSRQHRLAGVVSFGLYQLKLGNSVVRAGISYETFVHPDCQRQGLFRRLLEAAEEEAGRRGAEILFNFPNQASRPGFVQRGWRDAGGVGTWLRPVLSIRAARALSVNLLRRDSLEPGTPREDQIERLAAALPYLPQPLSARPGSAPFMRRNHDPEFLSWRFTSFPHFDYRLIEERGVSALTRIGTRSGCREAQVLEVFSDRPASLSSIRRLIRSISKTVEPDTITVLATGSNPLTRFLASLGFIPVPNRVNFFVKDLNGDTAVDLSGPWAISGVDIHTW
jgi:GNAT superfamily N-acetyltransferase